MRVLGLLLIAIVFVIFGVGTAMAQSPTPTPTVTRTPTATKTPIPTLTPYPTSTPGASPVDIVDMTVVRTTVPQAVGSVWAVCVLFTLATLVADRLKVINVFTVLLLAAFPLVLISYGWWAFTIFFWVLVYFVFAGAKSLLGR